MLPPKNAEIRCVKLLETLTAKEFRALNKYLDSPYFRVSEAQAKLMRHLMKLAPDYPEAKLEKPLLFRKVYGKGAAYREKAIRDLLSDLALHLDEFIAVERVRHDKVLRRRLVLEEMVRQGEKTNIRRELNSFTREVERRPDRSVNYYRDRSYADLIRSDHPDDLSLRNRKDDPDRAAASLDRYLALRKTRMLLTLRNREHLLGTTFDFKLEEGILEILGAVDRPVFKLYRLLLENQRKSTKARCVKVLEYLREHWQRFDPLELNDFVGLNLNAVIRSLDRKDYIIALQTDIFFVETVLPLLPKAIVSPARVMNIYGRGIKREELEQRLSTALQVVPYVYKRFQQSTEAYLKAHYNFMKYDFREAYTNIVDVDFSLPIFGIMGRDLQLRIYYEMYELDSDKFAPIFESALDSANKYYQRYDLSKHKGVSIKVDNMTLYSMLFSISRNRKGADKNKANLKNKINQKGNTSVKEWLIIKLRGLNG